MSTLFPGSSEHLTTADVVEPSPLVKEKLAALALDEPLPEAFGDDRINLLVQSPHRIYLYWDFAEDPFATLRKVFRAGAEIYRVTVRLTDLESGEEHTAEASPFARNYWFSVRPARIYRAAVGLAAQGRPFIKLLTSHAVRTPRTSVAERLDDAPEFRIPAIDFARALGVSGFASDALEVAMEARDAATGDRATAELTRTWSETDIGNVSGAELRELRALLAAIAAGADLDDVRRTLSPRLALILDQLLAALDPRRLRELLAGMLDVGLTQIDSDNAVRPLWGSSEEHLPLRTFRLTAKSKLPRAPTSFSAF